VIMNSIQPTKIDDIFQLLHSSSSQERLLIVLTVYFDESGIHEGSKVFAMGGYLAPKEMWTRLETQWSRTLEKYEIDFFHMTDCENGFAQFEGWSKTKREGLVKELIKIISQNGLCSIYSAVVLEDYADARQTELGQKFLHGEPYYFGFEHCLYLTANKVDAKDPKPIAFVFALNDFSSKATAMYRQIKGNKNSPIDTTRLGEIVFGEMKTLLPLQAADILAYEVYKNCLNRRYDEERPVRKSARVLSEGRSYGGYFHRNSLDEYLEMQELPDE